MTCFAQMKNPGGIFFTFWNTGADPHTPGWSRKQSLTRCPFRMWLSEKLKKFFSSSFLIKEKLAGEIHIVRLSLSAGTGTNTSTFPPLLSGQIQWKFMRCVPPFTMKLWFSFRLLRKADYDFFCSGQFDLCTWSQKKPLFCFWKNWSVTHFLFGFVPRWKEIFVCFELRHDKSEIQINESGQGQNGLFWKKKTRKLRWFFCVILAHGSVAVTPCEHFRHRRQWWSTQHLIFSC